MAILSREEGRALLLQQASGKKGKTPAKTKDKPEKAPTSTMPPPPPDKGPWVVDHWTIYRATAYEPGCRVVLTGPNEEFERLLEYLKGFDKII